MQERADWQRQAILDTYRGRFQEPKNLELLSRLLDAFEGATCPEVEDRYINILNYVRGQIPARSSDILRGPEISQTTVNIVGKAGSDVGGLPVQEGYVTAPALSLIPEQPVFDQEGKSVGLRMILVKNPFNKINGETFQWVRSTAGGWGSPIVTGAQNGLILEGGTLLAVEGEKNRETGTFEWRVKRPVFDAEKYEDMNIFKRALAESNLLFLQPVTMLNPTRK